MPGDPLGQGGDQVAGGPGVRQHAVAQRQPHPGGQGPRPGHLHLERARPSVEGLGQLVEVLPPQRSRPLVVATRAVDEAPPLGLQVHRQVDEQVRAPAQQVRPGAPGRQLGQVRHPDDPLGDRPGQRPEDHPQGLPHVGAGPRPDPGGAHPVRGRHTRAGAHAALPAAAIVPDPTTRVPS
ncbi:hypothetical protein [Ornithinimicrobium kibberense]|uniref:hypothetical protein n=1 Tax=Ornithinimicrobium kibberense TaxID=282060 RepID=UPI003609B0DD